MKKVFEVKVRDWTEEYRFVSYSLHKTQAGADAALVEALREYNTTNGYVEERKLQD